MKSEIQEFDYKFAYIYDGNLLYEDDIKPGHVFTRWNPFWNLLYILFSPILSSIVFLEKINSAKICAILTVFNIGYVKILIVQNMWQCIMIN